MKYIYACLAGAIAVAFAAPAAAQCPSPATPSLLGGHGWDGDEPEDFTHYIDDDGDGYCDITGDANGDGLCNESTCAPLVAWDAVRGVHPNGTYPDCVRAIYDEEANFTEFILQVGHAHYEYTHRQTDTSGNPQEKDYLTVTQAMQADYEAGDADGTATRAALGQSLQFLTGEPGRFERFLTLNPNGRYWQVDEWIGPAVAPPGGDSAPVPGLTWTERFFACGGAGGVSPCAHVDGVSAIGGYWRAIGGYWSVHAEQLGYLGECGDGELDDPHPELETPVDPDQRSAACGILFRECTQ